MEDLDQPEYTAGLRRTFEPWESWLQNPQNQRTEHRFCCSTSFLVHTLLPGAAALELPHKVVQCLCMLSQSVAERVQRQPHSTCLWIISSQTGHCELLSPFLHTWLLYFQSHWLYFIEVSSIFQKNLLEILYQSLAFLHLSKWPFYASGRGRGKILLILNLQPEGENWEERYFVSASLWGKRGTNIPDKGYHGRRIVLVTKLQLNDMWSGPLILEVQ